LKKLTTILTTLILTSSSLASDCVKNSQLLHTGKPSPCTGLLISKPLADELKKSHKKVPVLESIIKEKDGKIESQIREISLHEDDKKQLKKDSIKDKILFFLLGVGSVVLVDRVGN